MKMIACLLTTSLLVPAAYAAGSAESSWQNLAGLRAGQGIEVQQHKRETVKGAFVSFNGESLTLSVKKQETVIARTDVRRVRLTGKGRKAMWIGAGVGAGAGVLFGTAAADRIANESGGDFAGIKPAITALTAAACALIGLGVGALIGGHHTTVYSAP